MLSFPFNPRAAASLFGRRVRLFTFLAGLAGVSQSCVGAVELSFVSPSGRTSEHFENDGREIKLESPDGLIAVPPEGRWELRGDLK